MKTQEFLANADIQPSAVVDAQKDTHRRQQAIDLLNDSAKLFSARGKKIVEVNLSKDGMAEEELLKLVLGPTGNLRAPTLRTGKTMVVGFNAEMYSKIFG